MPYWLQHNQNDLSSIATVNKPKAFFTACSRRNKTNNLH